MGWAGDMKRQENQKEAVTETTPKKMLEEES